MKINLQPIVISELSTPARISAPKRLRIGLAAAIPLSLAALDASPVHADVTRPVNIVTLGDSIMWGQGLSANHKFRNIVAASIQTLTTRPVVVTNFARSGAKISPTPISGHGITTDPSMPHAEVSPAPQFQDSTLTGEVPWPFPSITSQSASPAGVNPDDVDLVLLNGGADDAGLSPGLGATTILSTDPSLDVAWAQNWSTVNVVNRMNVLLPATLQKYSHAVVVVVGYYPPVSSDSGMQSVFSWRDAFGATGDLLALGAAGREFLPGNGWPDLSYAFFNTTNSGFAAAVGSANARFGNRAVFAQLAWDPSYSFAGSQSLLWGLNAQDDVVAARSPICDRAHNEGEFNGTSRVWTEIDYRTCKTASVGHPNIAGAQFIADTIDAALDAKMCTVLALKPMHTSIAISGPVGGVQTVDVTATDAATGAAVSGLVHVGLVPTHPMLGPNGPTNQPFSARLTGTAGPIGKPQLGREVQAQIRVTAQGYCPMNVPYSPTPGTVASSGSGNAPAPLKTFDVSGIPAKAGTTAVTFTPTVVDHGTTHAVPNATITKTITPSHFNANQPVTTTLCTTRDCETLLVQAPGYASKSVVILPLAAPGSHSQM